MKILIMMSLLAASYSVKAEATNFKKKPTIEVDLAELTRSSKANPEEERAAREVIATSKQESIKGPEITSIIQESKHQERAAKSAYEMGSFIGKSSQSCSSCQTKEFSTESKREKDKNLDSNLLIFASSSIPQESLKALFVQAESKGAKLVFRGLIGNSFQKTKAFFETTGINGEIDPTLFEEYQISHVPAFVLREGEKYDILQGNISLEEALHLIRQKGELKGKAANLLKNDLGNLS